MCRDKGFFRHRCKVYRKHRCDIRPDFPRTWTALQNFQNRCHIFTFVNTMWALKGTLKFQNLSSDKAVIHAWLSSLKQWFPISVVLVFGWFGLYICPTKPKPIYIGLGKRKAKHRKNRLKPKNPPDQRKSLPYYFLFLSHSLNTEFEHKSMSCGGVVFRFVFKAKEKAATRGFVTAWFLRGGPTWAWTKDSLIMSQVLWPTEL